jgi:hypothetical protein
MLTAVYILAGWPVSGVVAEIIFRKVLSRSKVSWYDLISGCILGYISLAVAIYCILSQAVAFVSGKINKFDDDAL